MRRSLRAAPLLAITLSSQAWAQTLHEDHALNLVDLLQDARVLGSISSERGGWTATEFSVITTVPILAPFAFNALGAHWRSGENVQIEVAVNATPRTWYPLVGHPDASSGATFLDGSPNPAHGDLIANLTTTGATLSDRWRLRITLSPRHNPAHLDELSLVFIDSASEAPPHSGPGWNGPDISAYPKPPIYTRSQWGAQSPQCTSGYCPVSHLGTHHTAAPGDWVSTGFSDCSANIRSHQSYHMETRGWCDIGYNYLVCRHGRAWEGRAGGDDVRGAHDGYNCGSMGTAAMGYFHYPYNQSPNSDLLEILTELYAWKADQKGINPLGRSYYSGYGANMDNIYGHRDVKATACPGDLLYPRLDEVRVAVDVLLRGGSSEVIVDNVSAQTLGAWSTGSTAPGRYGPDYLWASTKGGGSKFCY